MRESLLAVSWPPARARAPASPTAPKSGPVPLGRRSPDQFVPSAVRTTSPPFLVPCPTAQQSAGTRPGVQPTSLKNPANAGRASGAQCSPPSLVRRTTPVENVEAAAKHTLALAHETPSTNGLPTNVALQLAPPSAVFQMTPGHCSTPAPPHC